MYNVGAIETMTEENPINEQVLEHWLLKTLEMKKDGKTLDDLIKYLQQQLSIIKMSRFMKNEIEFEKTESEVTC